MRLHQRFLIGIALSISAALAFAAVPAKGASIPLAPVGGTGAVLRMDVLVVNISGTIKSQYPATIQIRATGPGPQPYVIRSYTAHTGAQKFPIGQGTYLITLTANRHTYKQTIQVTAPQTTISFSVAP